MSRLALTPLTFLARTAVGKGTRCFSSTSQRMALGRKAKLNNGLKVDLIGYGTWQSPPGEVGPAVSEALKVGYRHIDCALVYRNQPEIAVALHSSGVPREQLFLVSKLWNNSHRPENVEKDLDLTLSQLQTPYLDSWLMHFPVAFAPGPDLEPLEEGSTTRRKIDLEAPGIAATWKEMCRIYEEGKKVRSIGVSNFNKEQLETIINATGIVPALNQIECHPGLIQQDLFEYCKEKGIVITAYSPSGNNTTGKPRIMDLPEIQTVAQKLGKMPAQVCIAWGAHQGFIVIPKSVTPSRIAANFDDFELSEENFKLISEAGKKNPVRGNVPGEYIPAYWPINIFDTEAEKKFPLRPW
ncbi:oxidoreductase [Tremella mesenterica]|uniref:Oxidoreductase n=1 Tax=Tremella mesenterica TaxID=5217 RepID=A0A4Q1BDK0_TREME|nr:oxidoreductase [Tremella mesenterica]